ncbi:GNAT family N-acetyltransferase [Gelidibacter japonicus]|uniref:GNAT family N-acetyltransferase n=1 Tax=Gelidibacter japonicus TaxID=1962232 RepID=UPI0013D77FFA|nr:GNAT family N-acetyltransferase [Gelidibacter japonicus]MCL8005903.1 N-acetyltransferase [Gelidibacter japonicus]
MDIQHSDNGKSGSFYIEMDGQRKAEMTYYYKDETTIDIDHTEVAKSLRGKGIGYQLIEEAVRFMRNNNLKVIASCSYAKAIFEKRQAEYQDLIK